MLITFNKFIQKIARRLSKLKDIEVQEKIVVVTVIFILLAAPLLVWRYHRISLLGEYPAGTKVFTLTGVASQGRWTLEEVNGFNSWWKSFSKADIRIDEGDRIVLRLQSADVTHAFYAPTLGIGPIYIEPGHVQTITFRAISKGVHYYYCMSICGECHYFMRGAIVVGQELFVDSSAEYFESCPHNLPEPVGTNSIERGKYLFQKMGCITCHGKGGKGGMVDPNYAKKTVPDLNTLASRMFLNNQEDADKVAQQIDLGRNPDQMEEMPLDLPRQSVVVAKYRSVRDVIKQGRPAARADTLSFTPPLFMPSWGNKLSEKDIDDILVYLLRNQVWEEGE